MSIYSNIASSVRSASKFYEIFTAGEDKGKQQSKKNGVSLFDQFPNEENIASYLSVYQQDSEHYYRFLDVVTISNNDHAADKQFVLICAVETEAMSAFELVSPPDAFYEKNEDDLDYVLIDTSNCIITGLIHLLIAFKK